MKVSENEKGGAQSIAQSNCVVESETKPTKQLQINNPPNTHLSCESQTHKQPIQAIDQQLIGDKISLGSRSFI